MGHARGPSLYCVRSAELPENLTGSCRVAVQSVIKFRNQRSRWLVIYYPYTIVIK